MQYGNPSAHWNGEIWILKAKQSNKKREKISLETKMSVEMLLNTSVPI